MPYIIRLDTSQPPLLWVTQGVGKLMHSLFGRLLAFADCAYPSPDSQAQLPVHSPSWPLDDFVSDTQVGGGLISVNTG